MIILLCRMCKEAHSLHRGRRVACGCGAGWGEYEGKGIKISGLAVPLGVANSDVLTALESPPYGGVRSVNAYAMPLDSPDVKVDHLHSVKLLQENSDEPAK